MGMKLKATFQLFSPYINPDKYNTQSVVMAAQHSMQNSTSERILLNIAYHLMTDTGTVLQVLISVTFEWLL